MKQTGKSLRLESVRKRYGPLEVLDGFNLDIPAGCFCTLLGASGSGKTTLLKLIAGFETLDGGRILVDGRDISRVPVARRDIGMVFQHFALFPHLTAAGNIAFGLEMRRLRRTEIARKVSDALALVGLQAFGDRLPHHLSGGQQQRVALARALVIEPDILLMDEPLGALDKALRQNLQQELRSLHAKLDVTIVFVTHDQEEALHLSDLLVVMDRGRIAQAGPPRQLYERPVNRFVAAFLGECNFLELNGRQYGVRPEKICVGANAANLQHRFEALLEDVVFLGAGIKLRLSTSVRGADGLLRCR